MRVWRKTRREHDATLHSKLQGWWKYLESVAEHQLYELAPTKEKQQASVRGSSFVL